MKTSYHDIPLDSTGDISTRLSSFLESANHSTIFHTINWLNVISGVFSGKGERDRIIYAERDGDIVGYYPILRRNKIACFQNLLSPRNRCETPYGGPIYGEDRDVLAGLLRKSARILVQKYDIYTSPGVDVRDFRGFGYNITDAETTVLDLKTTEEELWKSFNRNTKRNIKKAQKEGLELIDVREIDERKIQSYYRFVISTLEGKDKIIPPMEFYSRVLSSLLPENNARFIMVKHGDEFIGGAIFLLFRDTVYFWHVGILREYLNVGINFLIVWETVKWAMENGFRYFDFVRIERDRLPGIARFKLAWGGDIVKFHYLEKKGFLYTSGHRFRKQLLSFRSREARNNGQ